MENNKQAQKIKEKFDKLQKEALENGMVIVATPGIVDGLIRAQMQIRELKKTDVDNDLEEDVV